MFLLNVFQLIALASLTVSSDIPPTGAFPGGIPGVFVESYFSSSRSPR